MNSKRTKSSNKKPSSKKPRKPSGKRLPNLKLISTDGALTTATYYSFFLSLTDTNSVALQEFRTTVERIVQEKGLSSPTDLGLAILNATKSIFDRVLSLSCEQAAKSLAITLFLEKHWKKLDQQDPKSIIAMTYCIIRSLEGQDGFDKVKEEATKEEGKRWLWPLVWGLALNWPAVKKRWDNEESSNTLSYWQEECKDYANNFWSARARDLANCEVLAQRMISSLRETLGLNNENDSKTA